MKRRGFWISALLLAIVLVASEPLAALARSMTQVYDEELKAQLETEALALLDEQFQVIELPHWMSIQGTIIRSGSARIDVQVSMAHDELGEIQHLIHVFALHDGTQPLHVFREPSPNFYLYADQISPELLPRERLESWRTLRAEESSAEGAALAVNSVSADQYKLPWTGGVPFGVCQDNNNHFDFQLPAGTLVRAARAGVAINGVDQYGGYYVKIDHGDNTYALYVHLEAGSFMVPNNTWVAQGECLGRSGNTGLSTGAHLHFNVEDSNGTWLAVSFAEGTMPAKPALCPPAPSTPLSQNSTVSCGTTPTPTTTPIPPPSNSCLKPLLRYWNEGERKHWYTSSWDEGVSAGVWGWVYETIEGYVAADQNCYGTGTVPLYRLYHDKRRKHFYTTGEDERAWALANEFRDEGIVGYVLPAPDPARNTQPLYRCYSPTTLQDDHFYTVLWSDYQAAITNYGYIDEGIQCYVFTSIALTPTPTPTRTPTSTPTRTRTPTRTPTSTPTRTRTPTSTPTPTVACTPPPCPPGGTLYCPGACPGGCGYLCATATPTATPASSTLGGVNDDGLVNSTDALIILSADAGLSTSQFCPMNCADVNGDGLVNSTDALIVLTYDAGLPVGSFLVGQPGCPSTVTQPPGCSP